MEPKYLYLDELTVMGVLIHSMPDEVDFGAFWDKVFMPHHDAIRPLSTDGAYYGVWLPHREDGIPDYIAGMIVPADAPVPEDVTVRRVPASRYAVFECDRETIGATYEYIYQTWLPSSPYAFTPGGSDFEYYPPEGATDTSLAIYVPICEKRGDMGTDDPEYLIS